MALKLSLTALTEENTECDHTHDNCVNVQISGITLDYRSQCQREKLEYRYTENHFGTALKS